MVMSVMSMDAIRVFFFWEGVGAIMFLVITGARNGVLGSA